MNHTNINDIKEFIEVEKIRHELAINNNVPGFINMYRIKTRIKNLNTSSFWDELNSQHISSTNTNPMEWDKLNTVVRIINDKLPENGRVLNIGVGSGNLELLQLSVNPYIDWNGIDISSKSINVISTKINQFNFKTMNILSGELGSNTYDIVIALEVLEHINAEDVFLVYKKIYKSLKKDGIFILSVPVNEGLENLLIKEENPNSHVRIYTDKVILEELKHCGFNTQSVMKFYAFHKYYVFKKLLSIFIKNRKYNGLLMISSKT